MTEHSTQEKPFIGRDALSPSEPKTEDVIILGENSAQPNFENHTEAIEAQGISIADLLDTFYDGYVEFASDPSPTYVYHHSPKHRYDTGVHFEYNREEVAANKRAELEQYAVVAFRQGHLSIDPELLAGETRPITTDIISEILVTDGIMRAQVRYDESRGIHTEGLPTHVSAEVATADEETNISFFEQVKHLGAKALRAITLHSGEISLSNDTPTKPLAIHDAQLLRDPVHRQEVTETIQHVKPW